VNARNYGAVVEGIAFALIALGTLVLAAVAAYLIAPSFP
jgi:hypothetical protein